MADQANGQLCAEDDEIEDSKGDADNVLNWHKLLSWTGWMFILKPWLLLEMDCGRREKI